MFAWLQTCHRMYSIYDRDRARFNTRATLDALAKRGIELRHTCLYAEVAMKDSRQPSMYLQPAIPALYHGQFSLPPNYCRGLLGLLHFKGYGEDISRPPGAGWRYQVVTDEGAMVGFFPLMGYPLGRENYHLVFLERLSDADIMIVRTKLWFESATLWAG